jgi:CubicO group peptidase (beta-lactamase class C family)
LEEQVTVVNSRLITSFFISNIILMMSCSLTKEEKVDTFFQSYQGNVPGAAVIVIEKGQPILAKTYGMANIEEHIPVTSITNFRLASVTKQFTAMCVMMLIERRKIEYSTKLSDIFPEFPNYGKRITIKNLLQHTSGLIDYESLITDSATVQVRDKDVLETIMKEDSTYFEPGTDYSYSNGGYAVLAMIIEELSGKSFAAFLKENIFIPLEMNNTVAYEKGISKVPNRAYGYTINGDSVLFTDQSITSAVLGDGGIYSSINDLFKWDKALYTEELISKESLKSALIPGLDIYGFGWRIDEYKGHFRTHHTGGTRGFSTIIQRFPKDEFSVIILTNRNDQSVEPLAEKLTDLYLIEK